MVSWFSRSKQKLYKFCYSGKPGTKLHPQLQQIDATAAASKPKTIAKEKKGKKMDEEES